MVNAVLIQEMVDRWKKSSNILYSKPTCLHRIRWRPSVLYPWKHLLPLFRMYGPCGAHLPLQHPSVRLISLLFLVDVCFIKRYYYPAEDDLTPLLTTLHERVRNQQDRKAA